MDAHKDGTQTVPKKIKRISRDSAAPPPIPVHGGGVMESLERNQSTGPSAVGINIDVSFYRSGTPVTYFMALAIDVCQSVLGPKGVPLVDSSGQTAGMKFQTRSRDRIYHTCRYRNLFILNWSLFLTVLI